VVLDLHARTYRNGAGFRVVPTHGPAFWPSWSPDGTRIAYSTGRGFAVNPAIYAVNRDGSDRRLLARDAIAPAWSPDGSRIAYASSCGLRLVTPAGQDITPVSAGRCRAIGPVGLPNWSPDGTKIAIETTKGIYVVNADGSRLHLVSHRTGGVLDLSAGLAPLETHGLERPSWRPSP
jgi:Tol biopolymer transport system component